MQRIEFTQGPTVEIDLSAACENYDTLKNAAGSRVAAVVKCDGYGLGAVPVARTLLAKRNCTQFFVAHPEEGVQIRTNLSDLSSDIEIYVLNGPTKNSFHLFGDANLIPVINSIEQATLWAAHGPSKPCGLHIDTGMNRLGVRVQDIDAIRKIDNLDVSMILSHFACADDPDDKMNTLQIEAFDAMRAVFPNAIKSLANTAGALLDAQFGTDIARAGIGLYGVSPTNTPDNRLKTVASCFAPVLQINQVNAGETVGYGKTFNVVRDSILATVSIGYGDGYLRAASNRATAWFAQNECPVVGRISMDSLVFDVTEADTTPKVGDMVEIFGHNMPIETVAKACGTVGYELLTGLGHRTNRRYLWAGKAAPPTLIGD